jgi:hypothetical protein
MTTSTLPVRWIKYKRTKTFQAYCDMRKRCENPNMKPYPNYGGRGIKVCDHWRESFENFYADMGECPPSLSLDRKDNDGDYTPENCRWATRLEQQNNTHLARQITIDGETDTISGWAKKASLKRNTIQVRLLCGWSGPRLLSPVSRIWDGCDHSTRFFTHDGKTLSLRGWAKVLGLSRATIRYRLNLGMGLSQALDPRLMRNWKSVG